ncbi:unnamed protein product [Bursaphelenchus okinawaensis]|uniref:Enoyl-[acyl-carrier-protein] reductase, mitochondrial n=1 Tax=Bursaphelenchus okinawaensis TaxID=465554 RepID=A0A811KW57_9BILA|nr:unnamed protein product [Bursaphelenchus okinawaensis]CAG9112336.1 unnamed protein product [Bursaphelenchus okinawaensis]
MIKASALTYKTNGDPKKVLQLEQIEVDTTLGPSSVLVKWLLSPINPLDINKIEGTYPSKFTNIGGSEGVGRVVKVGSEVRKLKADDRVFSGAPFATPWIEYSVVDQSSLFKLQPDVDEVSAASLMINPPTAYIMLKEYEHLENGDYVIQNSANSAVGRCVIQLAKAFGYKSINLVRDRPDIEDLKNELKALGADFVFTEEEFKSTGRQFVKTLDRPIRLACNGVGGRSALAISASLTYGATCVTYGGMSKKPSEFSTASLVFNDLRVVGVAVTNFIANAWSEKVDRMFKELQDLIAAGKLKPPPVKIHRLEEYEAAIRDHLDRWAEGEANA